MIVYKAFDLNLCDRQGNKYIFNKLYIDNSKKAKSPHVKEIGFHFCLNKWDTLMYFDKIRICKIYIEDYYIIDEVSAGRVDKIGIAKKIIILNEIKLDLEKSFEKNEKINWEFISNKYPLTNIQLDKYKEYINIKRYNTYKKKIILSK